MKPTRPEPALSASKGLFQPPRLFIASSSYAKGLAEALAKRLSATGEVRAEAWTDLDAFPTGTQLLNELIRHSREQDFAVVLFTADDIRQPTANGAPLATPRDNCIFELGLFIGALGTAKRCYLLVADDLGDALAEISDLQGLLYKSFKAVKDKDPRACRKACRARARGLAPGILKMVARHGRFSDRPRIPHLTVDELMELEAAVSEHPWQPKVSGSGLLHHEMVIVKDSQPAETDLRYARVVYENMIDRKITYQYLFTPKRENYKKIVLMLRAVLLSGIVEPGEYEAFNSWNAEQVHTQLEDNRKQVRRDLDKVRERLFIRFSGKLPYDEFCIHSATNDRRRRGFLHLTDGYSPMSDEAAKERYETYKSLRGWPRLRILAKGALKEEQTNLFCGEIADLFPSVLRRKVASAFFGRCPSSKPRPSK